MPMVLKAAVSPFRPLSAAGGRATAWICERTRHQAEAADGLHSKAPLD